MFLDEVDIEVTSGKGGNGCMSFYRTRGNPKGGPDGGDGGDGGGVIFRASRHKDSLNDFFYKKKFKADKGRDGSSRQQSGKKGKNLVLDLPLGTLVSDKVSGQLLVDLKDDGQEFLLQPGGRGGRGNTAFATSTNRTPRQAETGELGGTRSLHLALRVLADVGLLGLPNAGKSTLLNRISQARPKMANYPFTTKHPYLGVVEMVRASDQQDVVFTVADLPGLIAGASQGAGMGFDFLKHLHRTRVLCHVIDACPDEGRDPLDDFALIQNELAQSDLDFSSKALVVVLNKVDLLPDQGQALKSSLEKEDHTVFTLSGQEGQGLEPWLEDCAQRVGQRV